MSSLPTGCYVAQIHRLLAYIVGLKFLNSRGVLQNFQQLAHTLMPIYYLLLTISQILVMLFVTVHEIFKQGLS